MPYSDLQSAIEKLNELETTAAAYHHAMGVLSVDGSTAAPSESAEGRGRTMGVLSGVIYGLVTNPENRELLNYLLDHAEQLDAKTLRQA